MSYYISEEEAYKKLQECKDCIYEFRLTHCKTLEEDKDPYKLIYWLRKLEYELEGTHETWTDRFRKDVLTYTLEIIPLTGDSKHPPFLKDIPGKYSCVQSHEEIREEFNRWFPSS